MDMLLSLFEYCNTMIFANSIPSLQLVSPLSRAPQVHVMSRGDD
jgi:hypothetical protein